MNGMNSHICECCGSDATKNTEYGIYCDDCLQWILSSIDEENEARKAEKEAADRAYYLRDVAESFSNSVRRFAEIEASGSSEAVYITYDGVTVRLADHSARPTYQAIYGAADIELGNHEFADPLPEEISAAVDEIRRRVAQKLRARRAKFRSG